MTLLGWPVRTVRSKLLIVVMVTTFAALAVATVALMAYESKTYEESRVSELGTLADVLAEATGPALAFDDPAEGLSNLSLLRVRPSIIAGALYDAHGKQFAVYSPEQLTQFELPPPGTNSYAIHGDRLVLSKRVVEKGEGVGTLYLVARYEAGQRLIDTSLIFGVVVLFSMAVATLVSTWLGRTLSRPIREITQAAHRVMERRDFSVRVPKTTQDEIGYLVDTFNAMLDEVGRRAAALEDADRKKDQFLAVLSHELRNPLNPIRNAVAVMRMAKADVSKVDWACGVIDRQARLLSRLLDDLMDVARITQNKIELRMQVVDLGTILEMVVETARAGFETNHQVLEFSRPPQPIHVRADPARLAQVIGNLLNNASKYTDRGGRIQVSAARRGTTVTVGVKDSGVGLAAEHLSRVFEMFVQVATESNRASGGIGVGLALVRALVEMHGGRVEARSEGVGKGSEFAVTLPTVPAPVSAANSGPSGSAPTETGGGLRILVADDIADSMQSLALALQILGHDVRTAADGACAMQVATSFQPEVAILDIGMPGLTGYELAAQIRQSRWGQHMLLIALTGWGQRDDVAQARASGFDHHMTKPADFAALRRMIDAYAAAREVPEPAAPGPGLSA